MGLKDRGSPRAPRRPADGNADGVTFYRRRLLEEVDLAELAELSAPSGAPAWSASSGAWSAARARSCPTSERTR